MLCQNIPKNCLQLFQKPSGQQSNGHFQPGADMLLRRTAALTGCFAKQKCAGVFVMISYGRYCTLRPGAFTAADTLKIEENCCNRAFEIRLFSLC